jgi:hypothetical protein
MGAAGLRDFRELDEAAKSMLYNSNEFVVRFSMVSFSQCSKSSYLAKSVAKDTIKYLTHPEVRDAIPVYFEIDSDTMNSCYESDDDEGGKIYIPASTWFSFTIYFRCPNAT